MTYRQQIERFQLFTKNINENPQNIFGHFEISICSFKCFFFFFFTQTYFQVRVTIFSRGIEELVYRTQQCLLWVIYIFFSIFIQDKT